MFKGDKLNNWLVEQTHKTVNCGKNHTNNYMISMTL